MQICYCSGPFFGSLILCVVAGFLAVKAQTRSEVSEIRISSDFGRISSAEVDKDDGNKLIAIRRIVFMFEDSGQKIRQTEFVEIQLESKYPLPTGAGCCEPYGFISGKSFPVYSAGRYQLIRMGKADFEQLKDGSIIFLAYLVPAMIQSLAEKSKNNDFRDQAGEKFGRLSKKVINRFPKIKENQDGFLKRMRQISSEN
jgi:hypothetical protein